MLGVGSVFGEETTTTVNFPSGSNVTAETIKCKADPNKPGNKDAGDLEVFNIKTTSVTFNKVNFNKCLNSSKKEAVKKFAERIKSSSLDEQVQQSIIDTFSASDRNLSRLLIPALMDSVSADLYSGGKAVSPFIGAVNVILGILVYIIFFLIILSTTLDLAYIGIPIFRESADGKANDKGKIPFISADAISVVKESEGGAGSSGGYKNPYITYFKRRFITYIVLAFCILYLVMGEISSLISWLLSLGEGLLGQ